MTIGAGPAQHFMVGNRSSVIAEAALRRDQLCAPLLVPVLSELVSQRELHNARVRQQASVLPEGCRIVDVGVHGLDVKARGIGNVKHLPAELEAMVLGVRHLPALAEPRVEAEEAIAANVVPCAGFSREVVPEPSERP